MFSANSGVRGETARAYFASRLALRSTSFAEPVRSSLDGSLLLMISCNSRCFVSAAGSTVSVPMIVLVRWAVRQVG